MVNAEICSPAFGKFRKREREEEVKEEQKTESTPQEADPVEHYTEAQRKHMRKLQVGQRTRTLSLPLSGETHSTCTHRITKREISNGMD